MEQDFSEKSEQQKSTKFSENDLKKPKRQKWSKKKKIITLASLIIGVIVIVSIVNSISSCVRDMNKNAWPKEGIVKLLPKPDYKSINIKNCKDDIFECELSDIKKDAFNKYVEKCKDKGFNIDDNNSDNYFGAKDNDDNQLNIWWNSWGDSRTQMSIKLESKQYIIDQTTSKYENEKLNWPSDGIAALLPKPDSENGHISSHDADYFNCYVAKISEDSFNLYIEKCKGKGFTVDFKTYTGNFSAKDAAGNDLSLHLDDKKNEMSIYLKSKAYMDKYSSSSTNNSSNSSNSQNNSSSSSSSVSSDLKSFLDSYEQFVDKYVAFMKKYKDSGNPISMLKEYTDLVAQMSDFTSKIQTWENKKSSMNAKDLAYFNEVYARCLQKLSAVQ